MASKNGFSDTSSNPKITATSEGAIGNSELIAHTTEFEKKIYQISDGVYTAVGYSLANSIMVEGRDGVIIIDVLDSMEPATDVACEFRKLTDKPVVAIVITHNHADHIFGYKAFVSSEDVPVYAHESTMFYIERYVNMLAPAITRRAATQFGLFLQDQEDGIINCGIGSFLTIGEKSLAIPSRTYHNELEITLAGLNLKLIHTPGETSDATSIWLPEKKLCIVGDLIYPAFPNVYALRGTQYRSAYEWMKSIDQIRSLEPEHLVLGHGQPISGRDKTNDIIIAYRDGLQFVYDQTIRGINQGLTPNEIVEIVKLPPHLRDHPFLREYYGMVQHHIRATYIGEMGWFDGDVVNLFPLSLTEEAINMVKLAGGAEAILKKIRIAFQEEQYQWGVQLATYLIRAKPELEEAKLLKAKALRALGQRTISSNVRNFYLTSAEILEGKIAIDSIPMETVFYNVLQFIPIGAFLEGLRVRLNTEKCMETNIVVGFDISDLNETYSYHIRNGIAQFKQSITENAQITITIESRVLIEVMIGIRNLNQAMEAGTILVDGNLSDLKTFIDLFQRPLQPTK